MTTYAMSKEELMVRTLNEMGEKIERDEYTLPQKIALTCRVLFDNGHDSGLAGQITVRTPEGNSFLTQRLGLGFDEICAGNVLTVDDELNVLAGSGMANPANRFHAWLYRARANINCIIHTHPLYTSALSMLEQPLQVSHMDNCVLYDDVAFIPHWPGVPVGNEEGELFSSVIGNKRAIFLSHHGLLVAGESIEQSCVIALAFERAARMQLAAGAGTVIPPIDPKLGQQAHDWLLHPKKTSAAFTYYARRALRNPNNANCLT
jgi:L-fuculose-phosphate aldolase